MFLVFLRWEIMEVQKFNPEIKKNFVQNPPRNYLKDSRWIQHSRAMMEGIEYYPKLFN
ncbi:unnamed protein product [Hymenolepis diminuta]|uniref:Uncharacterized protein n=1 Tax=Hymenolepis diminuta TaxID=6216 RepID=A0A564YGA0_HYMDI|nr:unnamed protein product [Hymenolepis diminuta]